MVQNGPGWNKGIQLVTSFQFSRDKITCKTICLEIDTFKNSAENNYRTVISLNIIITGVTQKISK